jgi:hypothetical protein
MRIAASAGWIIGGRSALSQAQRCWLSCTREIFVQVRISAPLRFGQHLAIFLRDNWTIFAINFTTTRNCEPVARNFQQYDY